MERMPTQQHLQAIANERKRALRQLNGAERALIVEASLLLEKLRQFVSENQDLYDPGFRVHMPQERIISLKYLTSKEAYRIQYDVFVPDELQRAVYLVPLLLLNDPKAYRRHRIKEKQADNK